MFSQRKSSQKPGDELLATFRQQFPEVSTAAAPTTANVAVPAQTVASDNVTLPSQERTQGLGHEHFRDQDPTPRASNEPWRFPPSLLDPGSFSFANFANQPPGYYTPTPGGTNTAYHSQAGDLHTPNIGFGMGLGTPLSLPTTEPGMHAHAHPPAGADMHGFQHGFHPQQFQDFNAFIPQPPPFAPSTFVHHDTGYETMDHDASPMDSDPADERLGSIDTTFHGQSPIMDFQARQFAMPMSVPLPASAEKFRFHATLNAPTAMIKHAEEIPVTYLNKGQAYSLAIVDATPKLPVGPGTRFRTFVRVSFEDEQQRQKPGLCWSLWKEGRGTNEAYQRGGRLQAVEYVEAGQPADGDDKRTRVELESSSHDGFSVTWTPGIHGAVECNIAVRFNFLSTDFSHSKGVKGIPVRLCAKTSPFAPDAATGAVEPSAEICYCKVKLFRDHGAERKLSNDVAHVKKTIDKLKQQIAQAESGVKEFGKRKRPGGAHSKAIEAQRPGKLQKHKRTWSMSSASSAGTGAKSKLEDDLHYKLRTLQDMFTSTRPVSVLCLRGDDLDDPDLHPVSLPGESLDLSKIEARDGAAALRSGRSSVAGNSTMVSPSPSALSLHSQTSVAGPNAPWQDLSRMGSGDASMSRQGSDQPTRVRQTDDSGNLTGWIEALGVDSSYRPPPERSVKPVACFYVARPDPSSPAGPAVPPAPAIHRAVYLTERTTREFVAKMAAKWHLDADKVTRTVHVLPHGLEVEMDDDVIRELEEGQDMVLEVVETHGSPIKREWEMAVETHAQASGTPDGYELRLTF